MYYFYLLDGLAPFRFINGGPDSPGMKITLEFADLAMVCRVSKYRICIAAGVLRISDASLINFADSTSAWAAITFDSPIRFCFAADDRVSCKSWENLKSFRRMDSTLIPQLLATGVMISRINRNRKQTFNFLGHRITMLNTLLNRSGTSD